MASKSKAADRRDKVEALREAQRAQEKRRTLVIVGAAVAVGLVIVGAASYPLYTSYRDNPVNKGWDELGVTASAASCDDPIEDETAGGNDHRDDGTTIEYAMVPPSSGPHRSQPEAFSRKFYEPTDSPEVERLVHNLEHGYTILWYDDTIKGAKLDELKDLAVAARKEDAVGSGKFIVSAWDDAYGDFPQGKHVALSHWGAQQGHRQLCGQVSGAVVEDFVKKFPASDAPEPNAA